MGDLSEQPGPVQGIFCIYFDALMPKHIIRTEGQLFPLKTMARG